MFMKYLIGKNILFAYKYIIWMFEPAFEKKNLSFYFYYSHLALIHLLFVFFSSSRDTLPMSTIANKLTSAYQHFKISVKLLTMSIFHSNLNSIWYKLRRNNISKNDARRYNQINKHLMSLTIIDNWTMAYWAMEMLHHNELCR